MAVVHTDDDIEPGELINMPGFFAFEFTQAIPHSSRSKADAPLNMAVMSATADTFHFERSWLKAEAYENIYAMLVAADTSHFDRS